MVRRLASTLLLLSGAMPAFSAAPSDNWGKLLPAISWTTDYRFNGISSSDRGPVAQLSVHWWRPDDFYAGVWVSQVDFNDPNSTAFEIDSYAGRRFPIGETEYRVEVMYSAFDEDVPGPTYDFLQLKTAVVRHLGKTTVEAGIRWSPQGAYAAGRSTFADIEARVQINDWLSLSGLMGAGWIERRPDRRFWDAGLTARWGAFSIDVRYVDSNLGFESCGFVDWCEPAVVTTLTLAGY